MFVYSTKRVKREKQMKILFLSAGNSVHTVKWVNALADRGHDVHLVFQSNHKPLGNEISNKAKLYCLKYSGNKGYFINALELRRLFQTIKPNVVNAHYASGYGTLARLARLRPLVLSVWGSDVYDFPYQNKLNMKLVVKNLLYADQIVSTSHCMADQARKLPGIRSVNIEIIPFGVDIKQFRRKNKKENKETICIGNIKTLEPKYGIIDLIRAVGILKKNLESKGLAEVSKKIVVQIYGDGRQKDEIAKLIKQLQLTDTVELKGKIPNSKVPEALEKMDIFCVTSKSESFGVSAVEAMAMELPVVATDVDGFEEVVNDGLTGIIVKKSNANSIAEALGKFILDENLRIKMGKCGRNKVIECYNLENNVDLMIGTYINTVKTYKAKRGKKLYRSK